MEVLKVTDNDDGSATLEIEMTEEERRMLINYAVNKILREYVEKNTTDR